MIKQRFSDKNVACRLFRHKPNIRAIRITIISVQSNDLLRLPIEASIGLINTKGGSV
jgi:hypothetical protein